MRSQSEWQQTLETVEDLRSLVRTMKSLSAVSIRQYETALESLQEFSEALMLELSVVLRHRPVGNDPGYKDPGYNDPGYNDPGRKKSSRLGAVIYGSDRGMCGRFNEVIIDYALDKMNGLQVPVENRNIIVVGEKLADIAQNHKLNLQATYPQPGSAATITGSVEKLIIDIEQWKNTQGVDQVWLFYNRHSAESPHIPYKQRLLPIDFYKLNQLAKQPWPARGLPVYSMPDEDLFTALIRQTLFTSLYLANAASLASEHASRLQSMQGAERNIEERLQSLGGEYRRQRQAGITEELLDVVSGFEVLGGSS